MKTLPIKFQEVVDFAVWYSGRDRATVERAYEQYLRYENLASQFREPSTEQSGGTEQEIEKVFDWAKCGIYHNHAYNEDKLRDCLDVLERVMKLLNRKP